jgi:murein DD-endopeptidase MepM/ murein hydrolase activator NlpD
MRRGIAPVVVLSLALIAGAVARADSGGIRSDLGADAKPEASSRSGGVGRQGETSVKPPKPKPKPTSPGHVFPIRGPFSFGGSGSRFGAPRGDHVHRGQDMAAATGTPLVAVRRGVISWRAYQAGGAGYYLVLDAFGEDRDYVYMHLRSGSIIVSQGQRVGTGQRIAQVGNTGSSSGPHLHFEVWVGEWFDGGHPIDPLPLLRRWLR